MYPLQPKPQLQHQKYDRWKSNQFVAGEKGRCIEKKYEWTGH
jgi:hypothetical protein